MNLSSEIETTTTIRFKLRIAQLPLNEDRFSLQQPESDVCSRVVLSCMKTSETRGLFIENKQGKSSQKFKSDVTMVIFSKWAMRVPSQRDAIEASELRLPSQT